MFLDVPIYKLESIRSTCKSQPMEYLTDMLATWLRGGEATPEVLVEGLRLPGLNDIARKVALHYGENEINHYNILLGAIYWYHNF